MTMYNELRDSGCKTLRRSASLHTFERVLHRPWFIAVALFVAAIICGLIVDSRAIVFAVAVGGLGVVGIVVPSIQIWGVRGELEAHHRRIYEETPGRVSLLVRNNWPWPVEVQFDCPDCTSRSLRLAPWRQSQFALSFSSNRRGWFPTEEPTLSTGFPFGLRRARRSLLVKDRALVWPRPAPVDSMAEFWGRPWFGGESLHSSPGDSGEMSGVRTYRQGDRLRRVHWGQTARLDQLIVCEGHAASRIRLEVLLDRSLGTSIEDGDRCFERALRTTAGLLELASQRGVPFGMQLGNKYLATEQASLDEFRDLLALAQTSDQSESDLEAFLPPCLERTAEGSVLAIVTTGEHWRQLPPAQRALLHVRLVLILDEEGETTYSGAVNDAWLIAGMDGHVTEPVAMGLQETYS